MEPRWTGCLGNRFPDSGVASSNPAELGAIHLWSGGRIFVPPHSAGGGLAGIAISCNGNHRKPIQRLSHIGDFVDASGEYRSIPGQFLSQNFIWHSLLS